MYSKSTALSHCVLSGVSVAVTASGTRTTKQVSCCVLFRLRWGCSWIVVVFRCRLRVRPFCIGPTSPPPQYRCVGERQSMHVCVYVPLFLIWLCRSLQMQKFCSSMLLRERDRRERERESGSRSQRDNHLALLIQLECRRAACNCRIGGLL